MERSESGFGVGIVKRGLFRWFWTGAVAATVLIGCKRNRAPTDGSDAVGSKPLHAPGAFLNGPDPWQWIRPSKDFTAAFLTSKGFPESALLPSTHPASVRMQAWLDFLFESLRAAAVSDPALREAMAAVPPPTLRITSDPVLNAWVLGAPLCLEVPTELSLGTKKPSSKAPSSPPDGTPRLTYDFKARSFTGAFEPDACSSSLKSVSAKAFAKWFNAKKLPCELGVKGDALVLPVSCFQGGKLPAGVPAETRFLALRITSTVPVIVYGKGLLQRADDESYAVGILAHELAHVLKSHYTSEDSGYDFFYRQAARNPAGKPVPALELADLGARLNEVSTDIQFFSVRGGRFDPSLFQRNLGFAAGASSAPGCEGNSACVRACGDLQSYAASAEFGPLSAAQSVPIFLGGGKPTFPLAPLPEEQRAPYLSFEEKLAACSKTLPVPAAADSDSASVYATLAADAPPYVEAFLSRARGSIATRLDLLEAIGVAYAQREKERAALYANALDARLGFYTVEQEADELALEFLNAANLPARALPDFEMELGRAREEKDGPLRYDLAHAECVSFRKNAWKDAAGKPLRIPLGSVADPHHGSCYRVFNSDREIDRHGWRAEPESELPARVKDTALGQTWEEIRKSL